MLHVNNVSQTSQLMQVSYECVRDYVTKFKILTVKCYTVKDILRNVTKQILKFIDLLLLIL